MKEQLEILYGEYMQLRDSSSDYMLKHKYQEKLHALDKLFENLPYNAPNPATEGLSELSSKETEEEKPEIVLKEDQKELLKKMSIETIKYFGALMNAFEIPNFWECSAKDDEFAYKIKIEKTALNPPKQ